MPSAVRGPVLLPPCILQRPLGMAGDRHGVFWRVLAPQRGAACADDGIYGGITYTDLPITNISYPSSDFLSTGKGVLLGAYVNGPFGFEFGSLSPEERLQRCLEQGAQIHPQYKTEFETGVSVAWHRVPWALGAFSAWNEKLLSEHYNNLCGFDGRIVLAGEHASRLPAWQEGAILSSWNAITRLHHRVLAA